MNVLQQQDLTSHNTASSREPTAPSLHDETLARRAKDGCSASFDALLQRYKIRLKAHARRYFIRAGADYDDLVQEAMIGFFKAVRDFNLERGAFPAFVELCVKRQVITFIKTMTRHKHHISNNALSLDAPRSAYNMEPLSAAISGVEPDFTQRLAHTAFIERLATRCSKIERHVLAMYTTGYTYEEIGIALGVGYKSVDCTIWRIKVKAKKILAELDPDVRSDIL